jgi:hypothetical protein
MASYVPAARVKNGFHGGVAVRVSAEAAPPKKLDVLPVLRRLSGPEIQTT